MSEYINDAHEIGWDDEISNDGGQYIVLEEGDYNFTVSAFERARFLGSAKIPACNKAVLTLAVDTRWNRFLPSSTTCSSGPAWNGKYPSSSGQLARKAWGKSSGHNGGLWLDLRAGGRLSPANTIKKTAPRAKSTMWKKFYDFDPNFFSGQSASASTSAPAPSAPAASAPKWAGKF